MKKQSIIAIIIFLISALNAYAFSDSIVAGLKPQFVWNLGFRSVFDNRECDDLYTPNRTYFVAQLAPEIGVKFYEGKHRVMGGVVWTQPIGCEWEGHRVLPTLYYMYKAPKWEFGMGMLPRTSLVRPLPNYIESDSARYFQSNIRGAMVQHVSDKGYFEALIDWRGMQSDSRREAFCIIGEGEFAPKDRILRAGGLAMMNHLARSSAPGDDEHVIDNFIVNPYIGIELGKFTAPVDSLSARVGVLEGLTRDRGVGNWINSVGLWADIAVRWKRLTLQNTLWLGNKPLFPLYSQYGDLLNDGEPYYASKFYNRTTLQFNIYSWKRFVSVDAALDFNFATNNFTFYQRLQVSVYI